MVFDTSPKTGELKRGATVSTNADPTITVVNIHELAQIEGFNILAQRDDVGSRVDNQLLFHIA